MRSGDTPILTFISIFMAQGLSILSRSNFAISLKKWIKITSDPYILKIVSGDIIEFDSVPKPHITHPPNSVSK